MKFPDFRQIIENPRNLIVMIGVMDSGSRGKWYDEYTKTKKYEATPSDPGRIAGTDYASDRHGVVSPCSEAFAKDQPRYCLP
jgi:hypothetical protein